MKQRNWYYFLVLCLLHHLRRLEHLLPHPGGRLVHEDRPLINYQIVLKKPNAKHTLLGNKEPVLATLHFSSHLRKCVTLIGS